MCFLQGARPLVDVLLSFIFQGSQPLVVVKPLVEGFTCYLCLAMALLTLAAPGVALLERPLDVRRPLDPFDEGPRDEDPRSEGFQLV